MNKVGCIGLRSGMSSGVILAGLCQFAVEGVLSDPENKSGESSGKSGGSTTKELSGRVVEVNVVVIGAGSGNSNELLSEWSVETLSFISSSWS